MDKETVKELRRRIGNVEFDRIRHWLNEAFDAGYQSAVNGEGTEMFGL